ncbi:TetR/AcrR family transcriptional regulator [Streptomyces sp. NPDC004542]|uniref:TetR/AcrR family transcriptional regulator n=1 Tax=Streptomyces sp. NPDC004542 TaxID=3154281 RepID=UPI0033BB1990
MGQQERAVRTRARIVEAAALEMDRSGYEGTTLSRVCEVAHASMGALTFHFPSKRALAEAVGEEGAASVAAVVDRTLSARTPRLRAAIDLTVALAGLLERDVTVRAAARVAREQPGMTEQWSRCWLPTVRDLLERARADGQLGSAGCPETLTTMVVYLLCGVESTVRTGGVATVCGAESLADQVELMWQLVLRGAAAR